MNVRTTAIQASLNRAAFRLKGQRLLRHSFALGIVIALMALGFGGLILFGWVSTTGAATAFFVSLSVFGFGTWVVLIMRVLVGAPNRQSLGAALERSEPILMDRVNTLLFLEDDPVRPEARSFSWRIARQAQGLLARRTPVATFPNTRPWAHCLAFVLTLTATVLVYQLWSPWQRLQSGREMARALPPATPPELVLPTNNVEQNPTWCEVRITDPAADLRLTKVDVLPMQIEAAASQPLKEVAWCSSVNGAAESTHVLPPPSEPKYAVYQPTLFLDEFHLSDWDVMTYYAKASTASQSPFASEVYFIEVRPFHEDILRMPGGENGKAYRCLSQISALISHQQHVIRETYQYAQRPAEAQNLSVQDRKKLSEVENDLGDATQHLYAEIAAEMENKPIGEALDNLARAENSLRQAGALLSTNAITGAQGHERGALSELVAARKVFQKSVSDHPGDFEDANEPETHVADESTKLKQISEFRDETRAAREFVNKELSQQRELDRQALSTPRSGLSRLGEQEQKLQESLDDFHAGHPQAFEGAQTEGQQAQKALGEAVDALRKRSRDAADATHRATRQMENLGAAMQQQSVGRQLADAYRLKRLLDGQIQTFDQAAQAGTNVQIGQLQQATSDARQTLNQLKTVAEQEPTRDAFTEPLRDALSGQNKVDLDAKLDRVAQADDDATRRQLASEAREALRKVSQAFADSEPASLQMAQKNYSLKPGPQDSFRQGLAELYSLIKQLENKRQVSPENQEKQGRQALYDLQAGLQSQSWNSDQADQTAVLLREALKAEGPFDPIALERLVDQLQRFSIENSERRAAREEKPEVTNIDPAHLPPAYRGRIQKYFQKLSEK